MTRRFLILPALAACFALLVVTSFFTALSPANIKSNQSSPLRTSPSAAFGESPFDKNNVTSDANFTQGTAFWSFTSSPHVNATEDSTDKAGYFNASSTQNGPGPNNDTISAAYYGINQTNVTPLILADDSIILTVTGTTLVHQLLTVNFSKPLANGDQIKLFFRSGQRATITVDNPGNLPPTYGSSSYNGGMDTVVILLSGLPGNQTLFNIDIVFGSSELNAALDYVWGLRGQLVSQFAEDAYINQTFTTPTNPPAGNVSYYLNATAFVPSFQNVYQAILYVRINNTVVWPINITSTSSISQILYTLPHHFGNMSLQQGGSWNLSLDLFLSIYTSLPYAFQLYLTNVSLYVTPNLNLLDDSPFILGSPYWVPGVMNSSYIAVVSPQYHLAGFASNFTANSAPSGWAQLNQTFIKNSSNFNYLLVANYVTVNMTGIDHVNFTADINGSVLTTFNITKVDTSWQQLRVPMNASVFSAGNENYTLKFNMTVTPGTITGALTTPTWLFYMTNISLYALWNSSVTLSVPPGFNGNVTAGAIDLARFYYNTTYAGVPLSDAMVIVYNANTSNLWGLDNQGTTPKYQVTNYNNGTYDIQLSNIGYTQGLYNLSVEFQRANFPDTYYPLQLNITGAPANLTCTAGAILVGNTWNVTSANTPYVNDTTKFVTIYANDSKTGAPISGAFVEAALGGNILKYTDMYLASGGNPAQKGYYEVFLDTTNLVPAPNLQFLLYYFTVTVTAVNYSASAINFSTGVNPLPTTLTISSIPPFYSGSTFTLTATFQDTFHNTGIDNANLTWSILGTIYNGSLPFIFLGFYQDIAVPVQGLGAGNYTLSLTGESEPDYINSTLQWELTVLAKYNVTLSLKPPSSDIIEGNTYTILYNYSYVELGGPLVGELVNFNITYPTTTVYYNAYTGVDGSIPVTLTVPVGATYVDITATYAGEYDINPLVNQTSLEVRPRYATTLFLFNQTFSGTLVGGSRILIVAQLEFTNGTLAPIANATLTFQVGTNTITGFTDANGTAQVFITLPLEGTFTINVTFTGSSLVQAAFASSSSFPVISPTTLATQNAIQLAIYIAIIAAIATVAYVTVSRGIIRPRQRARQAELVGLMNRFEDARNIQLLMVINKESGTEIYSKSLSGVPVDPTLVSGFLQAITSFGTEFFPDERARKMKEAKAASGKNMFEVQTLEFHHFKIVMQESPVLRVALLLLKTPSQRILNALTKFTEKTDARFGKNIDQLKGRQLNDEDIWDLIDEHFEPSLIYLHMLDIEALRSFTLSGWQNIVVSEIRKVPFAGEAYLDTLQEQIAHRYIGKELEIIQAGLSLRRLKALLPLDPKYMEFRVSIKKAIAEMPEVHKSLIRMIGDGIHDPDTLKSKASIDSEHFDATVRELLDLGMISDKFELLMPGKVVYTTLSSGTVSKSKK